MNFPKLYECDPQKNTECNKRNCGNPCKYTTRKEFSREPSEKMTPELAFMVLDVTRRERCEDTPRTRAACNVAQGAGKRGLPNGASGSFSTNEREPVPGRRRGRFSLPELRERRISPQ